MSESWMLSLLATETRHRHPAADGARLGLMEKVNSERYRMRLVQVFGFEAPIEHALSVTPGFDRGLLATHLKAHLLRNDLSVLGAHALDSGDQPPTFEDVGQALGWLYVLHRNTLFHGLLSRQLASLIPEDMRVAGSYLAAFDGQLGQRMRELGVVLDRAGTRSAIASRIVAGAKEAFRCQQNWYAEDPIPIRPTLREAA